MNSRDTIRTKVEASFLEEQRIEKTEEVLSPSGRFRLWIRRYNRGRGWDYSRGTVYATADNRVVCDIKRNYSHFARSWLLKDGQEWLVAGRSYMSQTIVCLETGEVFEPPGDPYQSEAFCWVTCALSPNGRTLIVNGCIWGAPFEHRFFDFSQPRHGWPELPVVTEGDIPRAEPVWISSPPAQWVDEDTVECYESTSAKQIVARLRLRREPARMAVVECWIDEEERARRAARDAALAAWERRLERFTQEDPLHALVVHEMAAGRLPQTDAALGGWVSDNPCPSFFFRRTESHASADLEWHETGGAIKVRLYDNKGNSADKLEFEHSQDGMRAALVRLAAFFEQRA